MNPNADQKYQLTIIKTNGIKAPCGTNIPTPHLAHSPTSFSGIINGNLDFILRIGNPV